MTNNFDLITSAFKEAGIDISTAEYSITEYSLNTDLSFKFNNADEFIEFLNLNKENDEERIERMNAMFVEHDIDPANFFYVNFYPPKVVEM